ncbi:hypothetical protein [Mycobacterium bohemicum]|uniref:hypothetical protein n=1 Tax=Mycobacterium bohemicum TaxID=56425 RepID=UPI00355868A5
MIDTRHTREDPEGRDATLAAAAFGERPERWPLPTAATPAQMWLRAVACGGQGRYGAAYRDLAALRRIGSGPLVSLAHSTQGSFLRQLGWHTVARGWDGRALALAGADPEARADALIGLAADALGVGRFPAAATLLARADPVRTAGPAPDRLPVRRGWRAAVRHATEAVRRAAVRHATEAVRLARAMVRPSARHRVKSDVVLAAALCSAGDIERARAVAEASLGDAGRLGLLPLRWALACLLIDIGSVTFQPRKLLEIRDICAGEIRHAGATWRSA